MRALALIVGVVALVGCQGPNSAENPPLFPLPIQPPSTPRVRVLLLTATAGFRHDSIETARQVLASMASATGEFTVSATENLADISAQSLSSTDVLFFGLTSGELAFDAAQKSAIVAFVQNGGGFIGVHSATDTLYEWPDYGALVGAYFKEHPWTQTATVDVEARDHPSTRTLGNSFAINEEFYTFRENPRPHVDVLLSLNASSVSAQGDFPLAWTHVIGAGRAYYNALGHFSSTWTDARFQAQLRGAILWAAKRQ